MNDLILHHYDSSPFSEKVRLMLGFKRLPWTSVTVPRIMPKPDVVALTGGHRRTPFLQVGADIWCDSALISRVLEQRMPTPTLFPDSAPLSPLLAQWADSTLFWTVIPYAMQPAGAAELFAGAPPEAIKAFAVDRAPFTATLRRLTVADATVALKSYLAALEVQVADGREHLFGADASIADFSVAHCLWFFRRLHSVAGILDAYPLLAAWHSRVLAIGHGPHDKMDSGDAVRLAAAARHHAPTGVEPGLGFEFGQAVTVAAIDYGVDPVTGALVGLSGDEVVIRRTDERAGTVHVHFPRIGFQIKADKA
jgi:glutathione S-transferase